jgi:PAS domain S-box-containing protein
MTDDKEKHPRNSSQLRREAEDSLGERPPSENFAALPPDEVARIVQELQVHQIELEMQNEELRHAQIQSDIARERYFDLYDLAPVGYVTLNNIGVIVEANLTSSLMLGVPRSSMLKLPLSRFVYSADQDLYYLHRRLLIETEAQQSCSLRFIQPDGTLFWAQLEMAEKRGPDEESNCRVVMTDITERKLVEEALRESEAKLQKSKSRLDLAIEVAALGEWEFNVGGFVGSRSPRHAEIFGYEPFRLDWSLTKFLEHVLPEHRKEVEEHIKSAGLHGTWDLETQIRRLDGEVRWIWVRGRSMQDESGRPLRAFGTVLDITDRKRADDALRESETRFRSVLDSSRDLIYRLNLQTGSYEFVSRSAETLTGYTPEELMAMSHESSLASVHPDDLPVLREFMRHTEIADSGEVEYRWRRKSGEYVWVSNHTSTVKDSEGRPLYRNGSIRDISKRKRAEETQQKTEERLLFASRAAKFGTYTYDFDSGEGDWSPEFKALVGLRPEDVIPLDDLKLPTFLYPEDRPSFLAAMTWANDPRSDGLFEMDFRIVWPDNSLRWLRVCGRTEFAGKADQRRPWRAAGAVLDITERKLAEERLRRSEEQLRALTARLQTTTELERVRIARELHDQLGQTLTTMKMDLDWIVMQHKAEEGSWVKTVQAASRQIDDTIGLVRRIATDLRPEMLYTLGLAAAIEGHVAEFQRRTGITCVASAPENLLGISDNQRIAIFRIFQESLANIARHAYANKVVIQLEQEQDFATLVIQDDGIGFDLNLLEHTQSLGIRGMRERALLAGAQFRLQSAPGSGTTVTLQIPLSESDFGKREGHENTDH